MSLVTSARQTKAKFAFLTILGDIERRARYSLRDKRQEELEEAVQEITAQAWANYQRAVERGQDESITACTLAYFAHLNYRSGRRIASRCRNDPLSPGTGKQNYVIHHDSPNPQCCNVFRDRREDRNPYHATRQHLDWEEIRNGCNRKQQRVLQLLKDGFTTNEIAELIGVTAGRISQYKKQIAGIVLSYGYGPRKACAA